MFLPALASEDAGLQTDAAVVALPSGERLAFSTDSFVVKPLRFPGGIRGLSGGTRDGERPGHDGCPADRPVGGLRLEEGFSIETLREIVADMAVAAAEVGVPIVTGDTKVVNHGAADGVYISTSGIGLIPSGRALSAERVSVGDAVIVSGTIADHGMAVMLARGDLMLEADIVSDSAPLYDLMERSTAAAPSTRWLRDATRAGRDSLQRAGSRLLNLTVVLDETALPVRPAVGSRDANCSGSTRFTSPMREVHRRRGSRRGPRRPCRSARPRAGDRRRSDRRNPVRAPGDRRATHPAWRDADRGHARGRSPTPGFSRRTGGSGPKASDAAW